METYAHLNELGLHIERNTGRTKTFKIICSIQLFFPISIYILFSKKDNMIPFGPFLSMSAILLYIWGLNFTDIINFIIT